MGEFLQAYGTWIVFGLFFLLMLRMHTGGSGCGMGHNEHQERREEPSQAQRQPPTSAAAIDRAGSQEKETSHRSGGCH